MATNQQKNVSYLSEKQFELINQLPGDIRLIMLGCDTEFFQQRKIALDILEKLAVTGKDLSVITKLFISKELIEKVAEIDRKMRSRGNMIAFSVSLPCFESYKRWEPKAPSPEKRIETLKFAHESGILTMVAIRPMIPTVTEAELRTAIEKTKDIASGYYSGPLYLKNLKGGLFTESELAGLNVEKIQPHWMPEGNEYYRIEKPGQMKLLKDLLDQYGKPLFEGAAEGINNLKTYAQP